LPFHQIAADFAAVRGRATVRRQRVATSSQRAEGGTDLRPISLPDEYLKSGGKICDSRVVQAGCRLAAASRMIVD